MTNINTNVNNTGIDLQALLKNVQNKRTNAKAVPTETQREKVYDPHGNSHAFQFGSSPAWWDRKGKAILPKFNADPVYLLEKAGGNFDTEKVTLGYFSDGQWVELDNARGVIRTDRKGTSAVLTSNVTREYNTMSYRDIVKLPEFLRDEDGSKVPFEIDLNDFERNGQNPVRDMLQDQEQFSKRDLNDNPKVLLGDLLTPWGCSVWQNGRQLTFQYLVGNIFPNVNDKKDKYEVYLTIMSSMDGTAATKFFLTIQRVVCKNTNAHAIANGWMPIANSQKLQQSIKRTANMADNLPNWHRSMLEVLTGSAAFQRAFTNLSNRPITNMADVGDCVQEVFKLDLEAKGQGKRGMGTFERVLQTMLNPMYGQTDRATNWLEVYNGLTAYITHERQVNNLPDGDEGNRQREEKLAYKIQVENDDKIAKAWNVVQKYAGVPKQEQVHMNVDSSFADRTAA